MRFKIDRYESSNLENVMKVIEVLINSDYQVGIFKDSRGVYVVEYTFDTETWQELIWDAEEGEEAE